MKQDKVYWFYPSAKTGENRAFVDLLKKVTQCSHEQACHVLDHVNGVKAKVGIARITVAMRNDEIGVAWCSNKDQYNKRLGKVIALGRLNKKPVRI